MRSLYSLGRSTATRLRAPYLERYVQIEMTPTKLLGWIINITGVIILSLGISTYFWPTLEARVLEIKKHHIAYDNTPVITPGKKPKLRDTHINTIEIEYEYKVDGKKYKNTTTSLFSKRIKYYNESLLPEAGKTINIRYAPLANNLSIINTGIPIFTVIALVITGSFLLFLKEFSAWFFTTIFKQK